MTTTTRGARLGRGLALALAAALALSACAAPDAARTGARPRGDVPHDARAIAVGMDTDFSTGGMDQVARAVEACYARASGPLVVYPLMLRGCLVQDRAAHRIDSRVRGPVAGHSPYWLREAINERWARYGVLAGFGGTDEILAFQAAGSDEVMVYLSRSGLPLSFRAGLATPRVAPIRPGLL